MILSYDANLGWMEFSERTGLRATSSFGAIWRSPPRLSQDGALADLVLKPYQMYKFRLQRASETDTAWLQSTLDRESAHLGTHIAQRTVSSWHGR